MGHHVAPGLQRGRAILRKPVASSWRLEEISQKSDDDPAQATALFHCAWPLRARSRVGKAERGPIPSGTAPIPWGTTPTLAFEEAEPPS